MGSAIKSHDGGGEVEMWDSITVQWVQPSMEMQRPFLWVRGECVCDAGRALRALTTRMTPQELVARPAGSCSHRAE